MKMKNNKFLSILLCLTLLIAAVSPMTVAKAAATIEEDGYCADISGYRGGNGVLPTKANKIFAGWYDGADFENAEPILPSKVSGEAYAKFIDPQAFAIKNQFSEGADTLSTVTNLRVITTVDSLNYTSVEFLLKKGTLEAKEPIVVTTVYTSLVNNKNGEEDYTPSVQFENNDSKYFAVEKLTGIGNVDFGDSITITPVYHTYDGTTVTGTPRTFQIWKQLPVVEAKISDATTASTDVYFNVDDADALPYDQEYMAIEAEDKGAVYVNGELDNSVKLAKVAANQYKIDTASLNPVEGTEIKIEGQFGSYKQSVKFNTVNFMYDGNENWIMYNDVVDFYSRAERQHSVNGTYESTTATLVPSIQNTVLTDNAYINTLSGGIYMDASEISVKLFRLRQDICFLQAQDLFGAKAYSDGTVVTIDGIFGTADYAFKVEDANFTFDGTLGIWVGENNFDATVEADAEISVVTYSQNGYGYVSNNEVRLTPSTSLSTLGLSHGGGRSLYYYAVENAGAVYVNGQITNIGLDAWRYDILYVRKTDLNAAGIEVKDGLTITVEGVFEEATSGDRIKIKRYTVMYDADLKTFVHADYTEDLGLWDGRKNTNFLLLREYTRHSFAVLSVTNADYIASYGGVYISFTVNGETVTIKGERIKRCSEKGRYWVEEKHIEDALNAAGYGNDMTAVSDLKIQIDGVFYRTNDAKKVRFTSPVFAHVDGSWVLAE